MATRQRFVAGRTAVSRVPLKLHTTAPEMTLLLTSWQEMDAAVAEAIAVTGRTAGTLRINTPGMAARTLIAPRLGRYHRAHNRLTGKAPYKSRCEPDLAPWNRSPRLVPRPVFRRHALDPADVW